MIHIKSTMFIVIIIILSSLGVSYGAWNEDLNMDISIKTGNIEPRFHTKGSDLIRDEDCELTLDLKDNGHTLEIGGWCCSDTKIPIKVVNKGSIPVILDSAEMHDSEIVDLIVEEKEEIGVGKYNEFYINIKADDASNSVVPNLKIDNIEEFDIDTIMNKLSKPEDHFFEYKLEFEQGI